MLLPDPTTLSLDNDYQVYCILLFLTARVRTVETGALETAVAPAASAPAAAAGTGIPAGDLLRGGSETLPPPLSQEEENFLLEKLKQGGYAVAV